MRRWWLALTALLLMLVPVATVLASGGDNGFDAVVSAMESRYQVHATRVPLMGLVNVTARLATHGGVGKMHVAEMENFTARVDGEELTQLVEEKIGAGWSRMVRETHRGGKEETLIYVRPEKERMGMFIVDKDGHEMDIVQLSVHPGKLAQTLHRYEHAHGEAHAAGD